jgi:lysozyme
MCNERQPPSLAEIDEGTMCLWQSPAPGSLRTWFYGGTGFQHAHECGSSRSSSLERQSAAALSMSSNGTDLLKQVEVLRLNPYDDQSGKNVTNWVVGATVGYGHLIKKHEWDIYKNGITEQGADNLLDADLSPSLTAVRQHVTAPLRQNEFDALVLLAFNIGAAGFSGSSVVKLVNDSKAKTGYSSLESAWKAWNKSQGKVMKGLNNRRQCEWDIYSKGIYKRW